MLDIRRRLRRTASEGRTSGKLLIGARGRWTYRKDDCRHHLADDEAEEIEAAQRYRTMTGMDQPSEQRFKRTLRNAEQADFTHRTW